MFLTTLALAAAVIGHGPADWHEPFPAHQVMGNVYYVNPEGYRAYVALKERAFCKTQAAQEAAQGIQRNIPYADPADPRQVLDVYSPRDANGLPVVFWIHGGGWQTGDKLDVQIKPRALMDRGLVFVSTNYRLLPAVDMATLVRDVAKSIRWVHDHIAQHGGDPNRVFIMGHSAGAQLAALICTDDRYLKAEGLSLTIIKGCVPVDGDTYDVPAMIETAETRWRVHGLPKAKFGHREKFGNDPAKHRDFSAVTHVARDKGIPPFLLLHVAGHPDTSAQAQRLANVLKGAGVPTTVFAAPETTHSKINADLGKPDNQATKALFAFLDAALGKSEPDKPPAVEAIRDRVRKYIDAKEIAGAVTLVATPERLLHLDASGHAALDPAEAMQPDNIFWIASMSKPVLATLLLMLQDEGLLSVDDPVEKYLPEFKELKTADGKPARVTIRQLLTHTSGMGEITAAQARDAKTLAFVIPLYVARPVAFPPGSKWAYCQSGINTGGRIAEVVTGEPLDQLLQKRLFGPLGMKDTTFYLTEKQLPRLARSYRRTDQGELEATAIAFLHGKSPTSRDRFPAPNGGLFSTARDYARFCQMVLRGGELDGKRYLKPETVQLMTTIQTGALKTGFTPGNGWGLGWCLVREPQGVTAMLSPGTFGHGGAYGTQAWIDPTAKRIYLLMVQRANFPNSDASEVRKAFQEAASGAWSDLKKK
jgi:CubicO group peptidase (beta-lactamase class C family)/poly(3-hydroxybutyrate) depolymerase